MERPKTTWKDLQRQERIWNDLQQPETTYNNLKRLITNEKWPKTNLSDEQKKTRNGLKQADFGKSVLFCNTFSTQNHVFCMMRIERQIFLYYNVYSLWDTKLVGYLVNLLDTRKVTIARQKPTVWMKNHIPT